MTTGATDAAVDMSGRTAGEYDEKRRKIASSSEFGAWLVKSSAASLEAAWKDSTHSSQKCSWNSWTVFAVAVLQCTPIFWMSGSWPPPAQIFFEDWGLGMFAEAEVAKGNSVAYAGQKVSHVRTVHFKYTGRKLGSSSWDASLGLCSKVLKGLKNLHPSERTRRIAVLEVHLLHFLKFLNLRSSSFDRALWACLLTCWQGMLRISEACPTSEIGWSNDRKRLSLVSAEFTPNIDSPEYVEVLLNFTKTEGATTQIRVRLPYVASSTTNACRAIREMILADEGMKSASDSDKASIPLFSFDRGEGKRGVISKKVMLDAVKRMIELGRLQMLPGCEAGAKIGTHSLRIGGATALYALGCPEMVLKIAGRWMSDCYMLYVRNAHTSLSEWIKRMSGSYSPDNSIDTSLATALRSLQT